MVAWRDRRELGSGRELGKKQHDGGLDGEEELSRKRERGGKKWRGLEEDGVGRDRKKWVQNNGGQEGQRAGGAVATVPCTAHTGCPHCEGQPCC